MPVPSKYPARRARYRKIAAPPYSFTSIKKMEPLVDSQLSYWLSRMDELFASPETGTWTLTDGTLVRITDTAFSRVQTGGSRIELGAGVTMAATGACTS